MKYIKEYVIDNLGYIVILLLLMLFVLCSSCTKTITEVVEVPKIHTKYITEHTVDSIYIQDSIFINQYQKGDTIYRDKEVIRYKSKNKATADTLIVRDTITPPAIIEALEKANTALNNANNEHKQYQEKAEKYINILSKLLGLTTLLLLLTNAKRIFNLFKKIF